MKADLLRFVLGLKLKHFFKVVPCLRLMAEPPLDHAQIELKRAVVRIPIEERSGQNKGLLPRPSCM